MRFVVGLAVGVAVGSTCWVRFIIGYWPWQGREAQARAGWVDREWDD